MRVLLVLIAIAAAACVALDAPTHGGAAWAFVGLALAGCALLARWRRRPVTGAPGALELLRAGLALGFTGFGGGLAVLTQLEHRLVDRERWIGRGDFLEAAALGQSIPGAISANTLGFVGWRLARWRGALALEGGFVLPSFLMMIVFGLLYSRARQLAMVEGVFHLLNPAVAGMVGAMALRLATQPPAGEEGPARGKGLLSAPGALLVAIGAAVAVAFLGVGVPWVVLAAGLLGLAGVRARLARGGVALLSGVMMALARVAAARGSAGGSLAGAIQRLGELSVVFLHAGALTFGGGYVIVPVLEADLVQGRHWLTPQAFVDAMALGQVTPGPVVITAAFVGYARAGLSGALVSTVAIFLPAFLLVALVGLWLDRFRRSAGIRAFLGGLQPAVVGLLGAATVTLVRHGVSDVPGTVVAVAAFLVSWRSRSSPAWIVLGAAALGAAGALRMRS